MIILKDNYYVFVRKSKFYFNAGYYFFHPLLGE